jgi:hypothetical protein
MKISYELEIAPKKEGEEYRYIDVEFEGDFRWENDGIGPYEYWGAQYNDKGVDYLVLEDTPTWDDKKHTEEENALIREWLADNDNFARLEEYLCEQAQEAYSDYDPT